MSVRIMQMMIYNRQELWTRFYNQRAMQKVACYSPWALKTEIFFHDSIVVMFMSLKSNQKMRNSWRSRGIIVSKKLILAKQETVISHKNNLVTYWYRTKEWNGWYSAKVINWCTSFSSTENNILNPNACISLLTKVIFFWYFTKGIWKQKLEK